MTPDSLTRVRHIRSDKPATVAAGSFAIATTMPDLPEVVCDWSIPLADDLSPMASAVDIACLFPYPTEDKAINGLARVLHRHWGFTTLSIRFPGMGSMDGNDRRRFYYYPESGSGAAWIAAISRVREIGGFPNRPVFVTGRSGGGSAAGLFADAHPEMVAAVANEAGRVFALPPRFTGPVFLMHGHHDYVAPAVDSYTAQITGNHVTRITFPPSWAQRGSSPIWQHGINGPAEQAMWHWLAGVANLRLAKGVIPPRSAWPGRFDGVHLPDAATAALVTTIPRPYRAVKSRGGSSGEVVFAQPLDKPKGIIALIGNSFASDLNDMAQDAEFLANDGWLAVAVTGQGSACTGRLRDALADTAFTGTQQLPWMLVVDEADGISDLMSVRSGKPAGIMLRGAQRSQVRQIMEMPPKLRPSVTIIGLADAVNMCRNMDWPTPQPTWRTVNANNRGSWQRESSVAIRAQAQAWIAALAGM